MSTETNRPLTTDENSFLESEIRQFIGWLSGDIPELHKVEVPRLADSWERFKERISQGDNDEPRESVVPRPNLHDLRRDICTTLTEWRDAAGPVQDVALSVDALIQYWVFYGGK